MATPSRESSPGGVALVAMILAGRHIFQPAGVLPTG